ncbi:MAG: hypothetical protein O3C60_15850, partial [Planctomycetota bacterium]|nr:hypothetical protein [Planctomycetota bacterium]
LDTVLRNLDTVLRNLDTVLRNLDTVLRNTVPRSILGSRAEDRPHMEPVGYSSSPRRSASTARE